jgi:hypothetical protein
LIERTPRIGDRVSLRPERRSRAAVGAPESFFESEVVSLWWVMDLGMKATVRVRYTDGTHMTYPIDHVQIL